MVSTSVIIPVYNDPDGLIATVESLLDQSTDDYEIIIADNGSTDKTKAIAKKYTESKEVRLVVEDEIQGSYAARNAGISIATGDVLGFIDADMWVENDYIESISEEILVNGFKYIGCNVEVVAQNDIISRYNLADAFDIEHYINNRRFAPTNCLVVHRELFDTVGLFDTQLISSGDFEFGRRVANAGYEMKHMPEITVYHPARGTLQELAKKNTRIGRGKQQLHHRYPDQYSGQKLHNPIRYFPPHPYRFYKTYKDDVEYPTDFVVWFLLEWILKLYRRKGAILELASNYS